MGRKLALLLASVVVATGVGAEELKLDPQMWEQPRSGKAILAQPSLKHCVGVLLADPKAELTIRYGEGDESLLQAEELKAWLISTAVESSRIVLKKNSGYRQSLILELIGAAPDGNKVENKGKQ